MNGRMRNARWFWAPVLIAAVVFGGAGCATGRPYAAGQGGKYRYAFRMVQPVRSDDLLFQDEHVIVQFRFDEAAIRFQVQNIARSDMRVNWAKMSIGINGRFFGIRHAETLYSDSAVSGLSELIPPFGYVRDLAIPRTHVFFDGTRWTERDLFPTTDGNSAALRDSILHAAGQTVTLIFPVQFGDTEKDYRFDFVVASVNRIAWKDYQPVPRIPAPPNPRQSQSSIDQVTAALIVVGVLGFAAYLITLKKNPPTE